MRFFFTRSSLRENFFIFNFTWPGMDSDCTPAISSPASRCSRKSAPRRPRSSFRYRTVSTFACRHRKWPCTVTNRKIPTSIPVPGRAPSSALCTRNGARNSDNVLLKSTEMIILLRTRLDEKWMELDRKGLTNKINMWLKWLLTSNTYVDCNVLFDGTRNSDLFSVPIALVQSWSSSNFVFSC